MGGPKYQNDAQKRQNARLLNYVHHIFLVHGLMLALLMLGTGLGAVLSQAADLMTQPEEVEAPSIRFEEIEAERNAYPRYTPGCA